jgi:hypothetical protein
MNRRHISLHLTPWAPGVGAQAIGDKRRWIAMWSVTPAQAAASLAQRLERSPGALFAQARHDDVEILGRVPGEPAPVVLALAAFGLTADELMAAFAGLTQAQRIAA